jgi:hypothetical protein
LDLLRSDGPDPNAKFGAAFERHLEYFHGDSADDVERKARRGFPRRERDRDALGGGPRYSMCFDFGGHVGNSSRMVSHHPILSPLPAIVFKTRLGFA